MIVYNGDKNYNFNGRDVRRFYDFGLIQSVTTMKNDIAILKNEIAVLKSGFGDLKVKLDLIISNMSVKRVT